MTDPSAINETVNSKIFQNNSGKITGGVLASVLLGIIAWATATFAPIASPTFTGAVTLPAGTVASNLGFTPLNSASNLSDVPSIGAARGNLGVAGLYQQYSLYDYCLPANVNGSTDNTSCFQAAVTAICSAAGGVAPWRSSGELYLPSGAIVLSNQISIPCNGLKIRGGGNGNTASGLFDYRNTVVVLKAGFSGHTVFAYTGSAGANYGSGLDIGDFSIDATNEPSDSWLFDISWLQHAKVHDISILNPSNILFEEGGAINLMENVSTLGQRGVGVDFSGDSSSCSAVVTGTVSGATLTVSAVASGTLAPGYVFLPNTPGAYLSILSQSSGTTGGVGVYALSGSASVSSQTLYISNIGPCNKRADLLRLRNVSFNITGATASGGGICINYHNFAQTLTIEHMVCESPYIGMNIFCDANQGNFGETCPAFGRFVDAQMEGCAYRCINSSDAQDMEYTDTYALGLGAASGDIVAAFYNTNFQQCPTNSLAGDYNQGLRFHGGRVGNSAHQNMFISVCEFDVHDTQFFLSNLASSTYPSIEVDPSGSAVTYSGMIHHNVLCEASGQQPIGLTQFGIALASGASNITVDHNIGRFCNGAAHLVSDNSGLQTNVVDRNFP